MRKIELTGPITESAVKVALPRATQSIDSVSAVVSELISEVRASGSQALIDHAKRFDGVQPGEIRVPKNILVDALETLDSDLRAAIEVAIDRVRRASSDTKPSAVSTELAKGGLVSTRYVPVDSVGLYVPGGKAVYPSSVVMNVVPAQVAGVPRIALCSPPQKENAGLPNQVVLATAQLLGISEVYAIGGASAIAAMAYGVADINLQPVRVITGPGNIYVAAAKRLVRGDVGIDAEAGPTEILIIADHTGLPKNIAADLISQAEHDENAAAVLVCTSQDILNQVAHEIEAQLPRLNNSERIKKSLAGPQSALVLTDSIESAIEISNFYATEHLEVHVANPDEVLQQITNAGAVFIGDSSPVSLGDYLAGSNHVLPTGMQAKFGPGLGVHSFLRPQQVIQYDKSALAEVSRQAALFANAEGLDAHARAIEIRFE